MGSEMCIRDRQGGDPQGKIRTLLDARKDIYENAADIFIDVDGKDFDTILDEIIEAAAG